jgi:ATPase
MENPRDLQVPDIVTQYTALDGAMENTADILLLVRPDYTIYDEVRKTRDFETFADMRLAGVGLVGVTHANKAIDAIQRLVGRVELGIIPHVVDTILFIHAGKIKDVYELRMTVKVPYGMRDGDLARPVIEVKDFETGLPQYELYSFGEEVVVIPVRQKHPKQETRDRDEISIVRTKKATLIKSGRRDETVTVCADGEDLFNAYSSKGGTIKIKRNSEEGRMLQNAIAAGQEITLS